MPKQVNSFRDQYQEDEEDDNYSTRKTKKKQAPPRFIKNTIEDVNPEQIVVNLSSKQQLTLETHYEIIETVVEELGWVVERSKKSQSWDIMWTDWHIEAQDLFKLNDQQKISHFPAIYVLAKKNFLGKGLMKMSKVFPQQYNYFPFTWSVPSQISQLLRYDSQISEQSKPIYIFKPEASCQGKGISLFSKLEDIEGKTGIVQLYVNNPLLIDNLKFDMRIYVLLYGCDPIRIYIYQEGLARFATQNYQKAGKKNLKDNYIHLTNYAINKNNKKFVFNTSESHMNVGHKRSLTSIYSLLTKKDINVAQIKMKIDKMIVKTLLVGKPMIQHMYGLSQTTNLAKDHCFQILGFDVLINQNLEPILLEVNHTPSFVTDTPLDKNIKKNLIKETFLLLNVNLKTKKDRIQKKLEFQEKRSQRKLTKMTAQQKLQQKRLIEKQKDEYESSTLQRYRKIYPVENNEYKDMEDWAYKIFNEQSGFKNKQIVTSLKNSIQLRPSSLENIPNTKKLKKKGEQREKSAMEKYPSPTTRYNLQEKMQKLPDISPKRSSFFKSSTIVSPKLLLKNYQFSPEKVFAHITEKYAKRHKNYYRTPQMSRNIVAQKEKNVDKKQGAIIQQKIIKLTEITSKNLPFFGQISDHAVNLQKSQKNTRKTFLDFISMNHKEKNAIQSKAENDILKKQHKMTKQDFRHRPTKIQSSFSQTLTIDEAFSLKCMALSKEKPLYQ